MIPPNLTMFTPRLDGFGFVFTNQISACKCGYAFRSSDLIDRLPLEKRTKQLRFFKSVTTHIHSYCTSWGLQDWGVIGLGFTSGAFVTKALIIYKCIYVIHICFAEIAASNWSLSIDVYIICWYHHFPVKRCSQAFCDKISINQVSRANITFQTGKRLENMTGLLKYRNTIPFGKNNFYQYIFD